MWGLKIDSYHTIEREATAEIKERSSRFIAYAYKVTNVEEVDAIISTIRKEHYTARHHCYAWRIGAEGKLNRANDDGEPSGTAGRPILGQLLSFDVSDTLVVVVRYFGGILLGTGGLVSAYKSATAAVLQEAGREEKVLRVWLEHRVSYADLDTAMKIIKRRGLPLAPIEYEGIDCLLRIEVRESEVEELTEELNDRYSQ